MRLLVAIAIAALVSACSSVPTNTRGWIEPVDAIRAANDDPAKEPLNNSPTSATIPHAFQDDDRCS